MNYRRLLIATVLLASLICFPIIAHAEEGEGEEIGECDHWDSSYYVKVDNNYHREHCSNCDAVIQEMEPHSFNQSFYSHKIDNTYHANEYECSDCGAVIQEKELHSFNQSFYSHKIDNTYHANEYECSDCGAIVLKNKEKHSLSDENCLRKATLKKKGLVSYTCYDCLGDVTKSVSWKLGDYNSVSYDIKSHSPVYKKTKKVTIKLKRPLKGSVLKVKIGKKTFKKKIKNNSTKQVVKIKKSKYGKKITIKLYYKGKLVGIDNCMGYYVDDHVLYGKNIKKGMTKKKVKNLYYWGPPDDTASASGGWSYWYYDDGSYIIFKKGKVKRWYNAAG